MSILIKGMEMPTSCSECAFCVYYGNGEHRCDLTENVIEYDSGLAKRREDCPLIELPEPPDNIEKGIAELEYKLGHNLSTKEIAIAYAFSGLFNAMLEIGKEEREVQP